MLLVRAGRGRIANIPISGHTGRVSASPRSPHAWWRPPGGGRVQAIRFWIDADECPYFQDLRIAPDLDQEISTDIAPDPMMAAFIFAAIACLPTYSGVTHLAAS